MDKMKWATNCSSRRKKRLESDCFDERAEKWEVTRIVVGHNNTGRSLVRPIVLQIAKRKDATKLVRVHFVQESIRFKVHDSNNEGVDGKTRNVHQPYSAAPVPHIRKTKNTTETRVFSHVVSERVRIRGWDWDQGKVEERAHIDHMKESDQRSGGNHIHKDTATHLL